MKRSWHILAGLLSASSVAGQVQIDPAARLADLDAKPIQEWGNVDLAEYLPLRDSAAGPLIDPGDRVAAFARRAVDQPFRLGAKRFAFADADCVTFTERAIAAGLSSDWETYYRLSQRLRHKDGVVQFLERNFFTSDWVTNNAWLLEDITYRVEQFEVYQHPIRRRDFYSQLQFGERTESEYGRQKIVAKQAKIASVPEVEEFRDSYIPRTRIPSAASNLRTGDVCLVIRSKKRADGSIVRFCDHMGIIEKDADLVVHLIHCAPPRARRQRLDEFLRQYKLVAGFKFLRLRENAAQIVSTEVARFTQSIPVPTPEQVDTASVTTAPPP